MNYRLLLTALLCVSSTIVWAQKEEASEGSAAAPFTVEEGVNVNLDAGAEEEQGTKRKPRRNEFYGLRTKPWYLTRGQGASLVRESFYYLKEYVEPEAYVPEVFWYDVDRGKIVTTRNNLNPESSGILHGPYKRYVGDSLVEEGNYYMGLKHGRWNTWDRNGILQDKTKWFKGWPKDSRKSFYDIKSTKLREVIPVEYGEENGDYYYFHENGLVAVKGKYKFGRKVGIWREYYGHRRQIKREVQYPNDPWDWDRGFEPYIIREYDKRGNVLYDREIYQKNLIVRRRR